MQKTNSTAGCLANFIVISLIPVLFFIAMILGYLGVINIHVPVHSLGVIGFILFIFLLFIKHNANYSICKIRSGYTDLKMQIDNKLIQNSLSINDTTKSILDIQKYLNTYYRDIRNDNFVSVASSIFPMLGILGTFVAIALSMPNFSVTDTAALDHEISLLLSGVGSAFFASIYGILLSLIWTYFEKRGLSKVENYFLSIQDNFSEYIWSEEELLIYKYTQYDLKENKFLGALKETFSLDFIAKLNQQHLNNFETIMHETNSNFTQLTSELQSVSQELKHTLSQMDISQNALSAQNHIDKALVDFTVATKSFEKTTKLHSAQLNNSLNRTFDKIDTEIGQIVIKLADFASHVSLESREVQDSIKKYHQMVANQIKVK
jgi:hypothetical protein